MANKFMLVSLLAIAACVTCSVVRTTPKPEFEVKIEEALDEGDKAASATEALKKGLEAATTVTEMIEAFTEDVPFVKVIGSLFSYFAEAIESKEIMQMLDKIFDEMEKQFAEINNRLDVLEWDIKDMMVTVMNAIQGMKLDHQFDEINSIQEAKKAFQQNPDSTTLQGLRQTCKSSDPTGVINTLHEMIATTVDTQSFIGTIFNSTSYSQKVWTNWAQEIGKHFVQAMHMQQVCLGVQINKDKTRPTEEDMEFYANVSSAKFLEVMKVMNDKAGIIDKQWSEIQLPIDIDYVMARNSGSVSVQYVADDIYVFLKNKYGYYFGVTVHEKPSNQETAKNYGYINSERVKIRSDRTGRTAVVNWSSRANLHNPNTARSAYNALRATNCADTKSNVDFMQSISGYQSNSNIDLIYSFVETCSTPKFPANCPVDGKIGGKYDSDNTLVFSNTQCVWEKSEDITICHPGGMGPPICDTVHRTDYHDYAVYVVIGF